MALVGLPHANVALAPGGAGGGQGWSGIVPARLRASLARQGVAGETGQLRHEAGEAGRPKRVGEGGRRPG